MSGLATTGFVPYSVRFEPTLEFGISKRSQAVAADPQQGLSKFGPYSARIGGKWHPKTVRLRVVSAQADFENVTEAMKRLLTFEKINEVTPYARFDYPGFESTFKSQLEITEDIATQAIPDSVYAEALAYSSPASGYRRVIDGLGQVLDGLSLEPHDVVAVYLPPVIVDKFRSFRPDFQPIVRRQKREASGQRQMILFEELEEDEHEDETLYHDLRRSIKVQCMRRDVASQIVTDSFITDDESQPWAGKLWNIGTSIFCKAGGIPWRLPTDENIAHCGIRFGISRQGGQQSILVGVAQVFSAAGELVALRAGDALSKRRARSETGYHLSRDQARDLIRGALKDYERVTGRLPDRLLIHKSSAFDVDEEAGIEEAAAGIRELEMLFLKSTSVRLVPERGQPADRGSVVPSSENSAIVYVTGFIPSEGSWRGKHVPTPIEIQRHRSQRSLLDHANELLKLTKMNWNTTMFSAREPCTFTNAREMIGMLKEMGADETLKPSIRYYI